MVASQIMRFGMDARPVTFRGLQKWTEKSFEKLGWIVLAIKYKDEEKIKWYISSLSKLRSSIEKKIEDTDCKDKKKDLVILLDQVRTLTEFTKDTVDRVSKGFY